MNVTLGCSCPPELRKKKPSAGCNACWTCETCGAFGGCDNNAYTWSTEFPTPGIRLSNTQDIWFKKKSDWPNEDMGYMI